MYFYKIHAQANAENEIDFLLLAPQEKNGEIGEKVPPLTAEILKKNPKFEKLARAKFPLIMVTYKVYTTDCHLPKVYNEDEFLQNLIDNNRAEFVTSGEMQITSKVKPKGKKSKISKPVLYAIIGGVTALSMIFGIGIGVGIGSKPSEINWSEIEGDDGLIMPDEIAFSPNAQLLTISIDRSWSPVPREDLQIKGEIIDGFATVTLPIFDKNDFFTHVPGHTWGFTTDPNATRIEYYGGGIYRFTENTKLYRVLVKFGGGNGTKDDPYLIDYFDQIQLLSREKARGYFKQIADIEFPCWSANAPIDTVNELKEKPDLERFEYDGGGFKISGLTAPLFGTVSGSVIKNVNVINSAIQSASHENYGFIVSQVYNYRYEIGGKIFETGETLLQNCTVSNSTIELKIPDVDEYGNPLPEVVAPVEPQSPQVVVPPGLEQVEEEIPPPKYGEFAIGSISGIGGQIEDCYVYNVEISANLPDYFLHVGGISGKPANVVNSGINYLQISGKIFHAGGIAGSAGGSRLYSADGRELPVFYGGNVQGCFVRNFTATVENSAGGIVGEGGTNAENALISNNYATGLDFRVGVFAEGDKEKNVPIKPGFSGGIIGADGNEKYGHLVINTVSDAHYPVIGSARISTFDDTVRLAPAHAFSQIGILDVLNRNTVHPDNPSVIFAGQFMFAEDHRNSDDTGNYPFPSGIVELFERTVASSEK